MSIFEFVMVLVSIIIGLGIAEILNGVAGLIRSRSSTTRYWLHSLLVAVTFLALIQQWWEIWSLNTEATWTIIGLLMMLGGPVCFFLIAHLLFPSPIRDANLRDYYYSEMKPAWLLVCIAVIISSTFRPIVFGDDLITAENASSLLALIGCGALYVSNRAGLHAVISPALALSVIVDIALWSFELAQS